MNESDFQVLMPVQNAAQAQPPTMASAATIIPTHAFTRLTGTTPVSKIVPPVAGYHQLTFVWTTGTAGAFATGGAVPGGIGVAYTTITDRPITLHYDPRTQLYYPAAVV